MVVVVVSTPVVEVASVVEVVVGAVVVVVVSVVVGWLVVGVEPSSHSCPLSLVAVGWPTGPPFRLAVNCGVTD